MNGIAVSDPFSRNEISRLSSPANWFISHTTSSPSLGQVDDSIIGNFELTRSDVKFNKYHLLLLFNKTTHLPKLTKEIYTGREAVSMLLDETPINFTRTPTFYSPTMQASAQYLNYDPEEIKVVITDGKLKQGVLDKASIGKGANGGVYHIVANDYGSEKALELMHNMQQMAIGYILQRGYTIGIMDLMVNPESKAEIDRIAADIINKSNLITERLNRGEIIPPIGKTVEEFYEEQQINTLSIFDDFNEPIMKSINPRTNNLFKLIACGSKGALQNMYNMVSAIGQKLINGERIRQKFGHKRTLVYFRRFETTPESRGYITNPYIGGMTMPEYIFNAMNARFDLISKALSTSVTGEQNRKSIKNLESIIVNNLGWAVKNLNVIQFAYGEDFLDPRKVEKVRFPTIMISDADFESKYIRKAEGTAGEVYSKFYSQVKEDRDEYRRIFLQIEQMNTKEQMSDERRMPVNIDRIIAEARLFGEKSGIVKPVDEKEIARMTRFVMGYCGTIAYTLLNEIQFRKQAAIPQHIMAATWLLTVLIRSYLHPNFLATINNDVLEYILDKIKIKYAQALVDSGTAVGIIAAQSFSEPLTQYMLDAHHRSAAGGTSKSGMTQAREVLGAKDVDKLDSPSMFVAVRSDLEMDKAKVQEIANNIEVMKLRQFVVMWQIFFEKYAEPEHPKYAHEVKLIAEFSKMNPLMMPPGDLIKWCIRMVLDKTSLILKNMSLELIINKLRETYPDTFIVYTPENSEQVVLRIYMRNSMFKSSVDTDVVKGLKDNILNTIIRGVDGILNTTVVKLIRNRIETDGSVKRADTYAIQTTGTNLRGVYINKYVDPTRTLTSAIMETARVLGIEAARQKIIIELRNLVDVCNHRHYLIYADEMIYTGKVTSIEKSGLSTREASNVLLRIGFSSPIQTLEEAAVNAMRDTITGVTAPLMIGSIPRIGTFYNDFQIDEQMIKENVKRAEDYLEDL